MKTLIVGLGSLNGNDKVGWTLIDILENDNLNDALKSDFTFFKSKSDGSDWYHKIENHQQIIFVDALLSSQPAGSVVDVKIEDLNKNEFQFKGSSHCVSLKDSITMAKNLALLDIPVRIFGITVSEDETIKVPLNSIKTQLKKIISEPQPIN